MLKEASPLPIQIWSDATNSLCCSCSISTCMASFDYLEWIVTHKTILVELTFAVWFSSGPLFVSLAPSDAVTDEHVAVGALVRYQRVVRRRSVNCPPILRVLRDLALDGWKKDNKANETNPKWFRILHQIYYELTINYAQKCKSSRLTWLQSNCRLSGFHEPWNVLLQFDARKKGQKSVFHKNMAIMQCQERCITYEYFT